MIQPVGQPDLFIIGLGVIIPEHVTRQASQALSKCRRIYSIVQEPPHLWLPADSFAQTEVVNALGFYREGELRANNYKRAALAITEAIGGGRPLGYVTYGNPTSYDRVAQELVEHGKKRGFTVEIVPGISSVDTILCDLMIDMAPGIQVFEASWLFTCQISPIPTIPVLLIQVGTFGSLCTHYSQRLDGASLTELVDFLLRFYPQNHPVSLVHSSGRAGHCGKIRTVTLGALCSVTAEDLGGASLYIPPVEYPQPVEHLLTRMTRH